MEKERTLYDLIQYSDYLIDEHIKLTAALGFKASVHIQVGAADGLEEATWVNKIVNENQSWPMVQVLFVIYRQTKEKPN